MAVTTPKIDAIITEFGRRIAMQVTITAGALADYDTIMTKEVYMSYVNRAMLKLFNDIWVSVGGDKGKFMQIFPELFKTASTISCSSYTVIMGTPTLTWTKATPYLDIFIITDVINITDSKKVKMQEQLMYTQIIAKAYPQYTPSTTNQLGVYAQNKLTLFCDSAVTKSCLLIYIALPIDPATGSSLTQNGTYDSPFSEQWNGKIAEIAEQLFKIDSQQTS